MKKLLWFIGISSCLSSLLGGDLFTYVNEDGVKVITNLGARRTNPEPGVTSVSDPDRQGAVTASVTGNNNYLPIIRRFARTYGVDEKLVQAIIKVESNFDPRAVSHKNCQGLMQLHPDTARRYGVRDTFDPEQNIEGGVRYLQFLMEEFDSDLNHVLAAYNAGENAVRRYSGVPPYRETRDYISKVRSLFPGELLPSRGQAPTRRVYRIVQSDGQVLFTNTPLSVSNF